jgi:hypothetical protein
MNMSNVETLKIYPADVTYVEPIASSYWITIKLNKISIKIKLIYVWNKIFVKETHAVCILLGKPYVLNDLILLS